MLDLVLSRFSCFFDWGFFLFLCHMNYYLNRFSVRNQLINDKPNKNIGIIIVIPCCNEPNLTTALASIEKCIQPNCDVEIITVINSSKNADNKIITQNKNTLSEAKNWLKKLTNKKYNYFFIEENELPIKIAGVGLARKIGMDEAVRRFEKINKKEGIILCFDADATCDNNLLIEVEKHFKNNPKTPACSIHFEHPIAGTAFSTKIYDGILQYELHLRYYKNGLAFCGLPYAFHTIGSSMAVKNNIYQQQNGMNKRKAGEDFYFLQKIIPLGNFSEIKTTKIIPSPRVSNRVPFGTGKAMQNWLNENKQEMLTYNINSFKDLKVFCTNITNFYNDNNTPIPLSLKDYLYTINFNENLIKIRKNSTSETHFIKLFFNWFNAFKVLKFIHFASDNYYHDVPVFDAANELLVLLNYPPKNDLKSLLLRYRKIDKI